ncbi:hypothetical protein [Shewanella surugensis]|uniref:Uncharacterized protein n=1 Tax=Shewanella surugensis TaxID=212020 RepID=A0ABT0LLS4_9GAMM|nr:hypothetical protein [Shewanella surugensis]MCL1128091.1 hypothetical protein [Shewanella surugensis]
MAYDETSIRVLKVDEIYDRFEWVRANELAKEYKQPLACVERGIEACRVTDTPLDYFIERYLKNNKDTLKNETFENAYFDIMKRSQWRRK